MSYSTRCINTIQLVSVVHQKKHLIIKSELPMRTTKLIVQALFILLIFLFTACDSNSLAPSEDENETANKISVSGALNTNFSSDYSHFINAVKSRSCNDEHGFFMKLVASNENSGKSIYLSLYIPLQTNDGVPAVGDYLFSTEVDSNFYGTISFKSITDKYNNSAYEFSCESITLKVMKSGDDYFFSKFVVTAKQIQGKRMFNGQLEDIELSNDGKIRFLADIYFEVDE